MGYYVMAQDGSTFAAFDLLEAETHGDTCIVTTHPVEAGSNVADHVILEASTLSLVLGVTNTPHDKDPDQSRGGPQQISLDTPGYDAQGNAITFPLPGSLFGIVPGAPGRATPGRMNIEVFGQSVEFDRIAETEQKLTDMREARALIQVVTLSRTYIDMIMVRSELQRTRIGDARFSIDLVGIRFVQTGTVAAPVPIEPKGKPLAKKGQQATSTPGDLSSLLNNSLILKGAEALGFQL